MKKTICIFIVIVIFSMFFTGCGNNNLTFTYEGESYSLEDTKRELKKRHPITSEENDDGDLFIYDSYMFPGATDDYKVAHTVFFVSFNAKGKMNSLSACDRAVECPYGLRVGDSKAKVEDVFGPDRIYDDDYLGFIHVSLNENGKAVTRSSGEGKYSLTFSYSSRGIITQIILG